MTAPPSSSGSSFSGPSSPSSLSSSSSPSDNDFGSPLSPDHLRSFRASLSPSKYPDRFIPSRRVADRASNIFHLSKSPQELSWSERVLRQSTTSSDPFVPRRNVSNRVPQRSSTPQEAGHSRITPRSISTGAVWNVGGPAPHSGPVVGVDGDHGGLLGSGTNAPIYSAGFFRSEPPDQGHERYVDKLAAALEIDLANRVLDSPPRPEYHEPRAGSRDSFPSTEWHDIAWTDRGSTAKKVEQKPIPEVPFR